MMSCAPSRQAIYFNNIKAGKDTVDQKFTTAVKRIYPGDRVSIMIVTQNMEANQIFNAQQMIGGNGGGGAGGAGGGQGGSTMGYLVDKNGDIEIPILGKLKIAGLTPDEVTEYVRLKVGALYKDPSVQSFLTGRVVVLGDAGAQGSVQILNDRLTIFEALSLSGIVDPTARRDRVWLVRETNGLRDYVQLNLNDRSIFQSEYYYLRNNDLLYVEPGRLNTFLGVNAPARSLFTLFASSFALIISIIAITQ
jgi:polysaccharide export outer membrane protein